MTCKRKKKFKSSSIKDYFREFVVGENKYNYYMNLFRLV